MPCLEILSSPSASSLFSTLLSSGYAITTDCVIIGRAACSKFGELHAYGT